MVYGTYNELVGANLNQLTSLGGPTNCTLWSMNIHHRWCYQKPPFVEDLPAARHLVTRDFTSSHDHGSSSKCKMPSWCSEFLRKMWKADVHFFKKAQKMMFHAVWNNNTVCSKMSLETYCKDLWLDLSYQPLNHGILVINHPKKIPSVIGSDVHRFHLRFGHQLPGLVNIQKALENGHRNTWFTH